MTRINLKEYAHCEYRLSVAERDTLKEVLPSVTIEPVAGEEDRYQLTAGSEVGALEIGELSVLIEPKIDMTQLLSIACYAMSEFKIQHELFDFPPEYALPDALALALASAARRAFSRGLLHGYRTEEEALQTVRGRIRFDDQIRRRFGIPLPVEVRYDEFTDDIPANRLVKAAVYALARMRLRSPDARRGLARTAAVLENVSLVEFSPRDVPEISFDRLNSHYREVVALSRLILERNAYESDRGEIRASGFLMDMNQVFQEFVTQALRESLGVSERFLRFDKNLPRRVHLDEANKIRLEPDLSWWDGETCLFVGDAKYKRISERGGIPNADVYQLLAYATALDLPGGLLIYAQGEADAATHTVRYADKRLEVAALDMSGGLDEILGRVNYLAKKIRKLRADASTRRAAGATRLPQPSASPMMSGMKSIDEVIADFESRGVGLRSTDNLTRDELYDEAINGPDAIR